MAEDTCHRGHAWTPENTALWRDGYRRCRTCLRERDLRYQHSAEGRAARQRYDASSRKKLSRRRWNGTTEAWIAKRKYILKGARESIEAELASLAAEEAELWVQASSKPAPTR